MNNEEKIWERLYVEFKNPYGVAALMGNLYAESALNPLLANNVKKLGVTSTEYTRQVDSGERDFISDGIAYGIAQWCYRTRKQWLLNKAKEMKKSVGDLDVQLEYLIEELKKYSTVNKALREATSIRAASDIVLTRYEKPANQSTSVKEKRASYGQKYYRTYNLQKQLNISQKTALKMLIALNTST